MNIEYATIDVPARLADLEFRISLPSHWVAPELPEPETDIEEPTRFAPLMVRLMPYSTVIFAVAARPAFGDGTIHHWVPYLLKSQGFSVESRTAEQVNGLEMIVGCGQKPDPDDVTRCLHYAFFEDGGRLVSIFLTGPLELKDSLAATWEFVFRSFVLARPRGQTAHVQVVDESATV